MAFVWRLRGVGVFLAFLVACFGIPRRQGLCYYRGPGAEQFPAFPGQQLLLQLYACAVTCGRDIVLCSWARHLTLTVPLSIQVYKWVPANLMLGVTLQWTGIPSRGGVEILLVPSCHRNRS